MEIPEGRMPREWSQAVSSGAQWQRQWAQNETQVVFPLNIREHLFLYCEDDRVLAQFAQR